MEIEFRDGCFFAGTVPLAMSASHRKVVGNKFEGKYKINDYE